MWSIRSIMCSSAGSGRWQPSARRWRGSSPAGRAHVAGRAARLEAPGRSFHIDGSSSKWISTGELACQPQATSALAFSRIPRHDDRRTRWGAIFATRPSKEKPMCICIFGVGRADRGDARGDCRPARDRRDFVRRVMTEAEAVADALGVVLPQPMEKRIESRWLHVSTGCRCCKTSRAADRSRSTCWPAPSPRCAAWSASRGRPTTWFSDLARLRGIREV